MVNKNSPMGMMKGTTMKTLISTIALIATVSSASAGAWTDYVEAGGEVSTLSLAVALDTAHNFQETYMEDIAELEAEALSLGLTNEELKADIEYLAADYADLEEDYADVSEDMLYYKERRAELLLEIEEVKDNSKAWKKVKKLRRQRNEAREALNTVNARIDAASSALNMPFDLTVDISGAAYGNPNRGWGGNFDIGVWTSNHFEEGDVATMYFHFDNNATISSIHEELSENILDFGLNAYTTGYNAGYVDGYAAAIAAIVASPIGETN